MTLAEARLFEELTLNSSGALKQIIYDGWVLRFSPGSNVKRANSVTALYPSVLSIDEKLDYCEAIYAREGLSLQFRISEISAPHDLDERLAARGYAKIEPTLFMTLPLGTQESGSQTASVSQLPLVDWLQISHVLRGDAKETIEAHYARLQSIPLSRIPLALFDNGKPVCVGLGIQQGDHFGLFDIFTSPTERKLGYSKLMTRSLLQTARREQARVAFLQVAESNIPARHIYENAGFFPAYCYWYRSKRVE